MENLKTYKKLTTDTFNECIKGEAKHGGFCFPLNSKGVRELNEALIEALKDKVYDRETVKDNAKDNFMQRNTRQW